MNNKKNMSPLELQKIIHYIMIVYIVISLLSFGYLSYGYLKSDVYDRGYQKAILDIATRSLAAEGCDSGVVLGLGNEQYTYVKNVQCPADTVENSTIQEEGDFLFPDIPPLEK